MKIKTVLTSSVSFLKIRWQMFCRLSKLFKLLSAVFAIYFMAFLFITPSAMMVIEAQSQSMQFTTIDDRSALIGISNHALIDDGSPDSIEHCVMGSLQVLRNISVSYELLASNLIISLEESYLDSINSKPKRLLSTESISGGEPNIVGNFRTQTGTQINLYPGASVSIGPDVECTLEFLEQDNAFFKIDGKPYVQPIRIPIWGPGRLGSELRFQSADGDPANAYEGLLLRGKVSIFGRYITDTSRLYPAGEFELSSGSQLATPALKSDGIYGYALYEPGRAVAGTFSSFSVSVTSISPYLLLTRAFPHDANSIDVVRMEVSFFSSLFRDPSLLLAQGLFLGLITIAQGFAAFRGLGRSST